MGENDAHHDAGGAEAELHPHRLVQGAQGAGGCRETRGQECLHLGGDAFSWAYWPRCGRPASLRSVVAYPGGWRRYYREHLQPAGTRSSPAGCPHGQKLPGGLWNQPVFRHCGDGDQSPHRPDLCLLGSEGKV